MRPDTDDLDDEIRGHLALSIQERLEGVPPEKVLETFPVEKRLEGVPKEDLVAALTPEERMQGLSVEALEAQLRKLKGERSSQA